MQTINISKNKYSEKDEGNSNHCNIEPSIQFPKTKQEALTLLDMGGAPGAPP